MNDKLVGEKELSEIIGIPVMSLQSMRSRGEGPPFIKIGRSVRYSLRAVEKYLAANTVEPGKSARR